MSISDQQPKNYRRKNNQASTAKSPHTSKVSKTESVDIDQNLI